MSVVGAPVIMAWSASSGDFAQRGGPLRIESRLATGSRYMKRVGTSGKMLLMKLKKSRVIEVNLRKYARCDANLRRPIVRTRCLKSAADSASGSGTLCQESVRRAMI